MFSLWCVRFLVPIVLPCSCLFVLLRLLSGLVCGCFVCCPLFVSGFIGLPCLRVCVIAFFDVCLLVSFCVCCVRSLFIVMRCSVGVCVIAFFSGCVLCSLPVWCVLVLWLFLFDLFCVVFGIVFVSCLYCSAFLCLCL